MNDTRWLRVLVIVGFSALILGLADPLELSLVVVLGAGLVTIAAILGHSRYRMLIVASFALVCVGVSVMWWLSALGGFGGHTNRSGWWALMILPYPAGWFMAIVGAIRRLGEAPAGVA